MRVSPIRELHYFAATCLGLNYADFAITVLVLSQGAVESNPIFQLLGGPFSLPSMTIKLVLVPLTVLWATHRGMVTTFRRRTIYSAFLIGMMTLLSYAVVRNVVLSMVLAAK